LYRNINIDICSSAFLFVCSKLSQPNGPSAEIAGRNSEQTTTSTELKRKNWQLFVVGMGETIKEEWREKESKKKKKEEKGSRSKSRCSSACPEDEGLEECWLAQEVRERASDKNSRRASAARGDGAHHFNDKERKKKEGGRICGESARRLEPDPGFGFCADAPPR